jgi:hypothetical protein
MAKQIVLEARLKGAGKTKRGLKGIDSGLKSLGKSAIAAGAAFFGSRAIISGLKHSVELASKVEGLRRGFDNLTRSAGFSAQTFSKLQKATDGTMSSFDLMKQANNAMLLGIFDSEDAMAKMFDTAQRLAQALGKDAAFGVESLVTGMGRQSKLMLDNLGIMVKAEDAYKQYAAELDKSVSELTDQERKQAFVNEAMKEANKLVKSLGEEQLTTADAIKQMKTASSDTAIIIGTLLSPFVVKAAEHLGTLAKKAQEFFNAFRADEIALQAAEIKGLNQAIEGTEKQVDRLRTAQKDIFLFSDQSSQMAVSRMKSVIILMQELLSPDQLKTFFGKGKEEQIKILEEIVAAHIEAAQEMKDEIDVITGGVPPGGITEDDIDDQKKKQKEIINMAGLMGQALGTAFDPDLGAGEAFKGFVIQLMSAMQGVILASKAVSEALTFTFTGPLGIATAITALVALEAAKAGVRSLEFAQGGDFVTSGPQMIMVGDNPGGKERVQVTPLSSPNIEGPQGGNIHLHFGAVTNEDYVKDFIVPEIQKAQRLNLA